VTRSLELFDTHCHIDFPAFARDREELLRTARDVGVAEMFVPGTDPQQWRGLGKLVSAHIQRTPRLHVGVGVHPHRLGGMKARERDVALGELRSQAIELGARAIGECGLDDPLARRGGPTLPEQLAVFEEHLAVANALSLPVVLHVVRAHGAALDALARKPVRRGGIVHWYSGGPELLPRYADLGFRVGFGAACLDPRQRRVRASAANAPGGCLVLETDAPDQPPPDGPRRNEPATLLRVAEEVARLRGTTVEEIAVASTRNARTAFGLDVP